MNEENETSLAEMDALSFVLSLSFFPPKESYSVVQDAEERREKGVTMNSILKFCLRVLIGFFFSRLKKKARKAEKREKEKENSRRRATQTQTRERKKISHTFLVEKKMPPKLHQPFLSKHQRVLTS